MKKVTESVLMADVEPGGGEGVALTVTVPWVTMPPA
jgi:hypothetical protein